MDVLYLCIILTFFCLPIEGVEHKFEKATEYLTQYGYLERNSISNSSLFSTKSFRKSLRQFQSFVGIPVTGKLDKVTMKMMNVPRCGVSDKTWKSDRLKRYSLIGSVWNTKHLTYKISKYSRKLRRRLINRTIQKAANLWSKYTDLTFEPSRWGEIDIRFEKGVHGINPSDPPFEGRDGIVAHAFSPIDGGAIHFDDSELWTIGSGSGTDLYRVAAHEFGHSLGLGHTDVKDALMYEWYNPKWNGDLHPDDIEGIQQLYGRKFEDIAPIQQLDSPYDIPVFSPGFTPPFSSGILSRLFSGFVRRR